MKSAIGILENICFPGKDPALTYDAVVVGADKMLSSLCMTALENSLTGLEFAYGIPGTVGGAVYMNAGAYGGEMKDVLVSVRYLTTEGETVEIPAEQLDLRYRHSIFEENGGCILSAKFHLARGNAADIRARMDDLMARRNGVNLVYVKSCDNVERILSFMGAAEASAQLSAQKAVKQMRNQINRHTNCDTANLGKTARANAQTLKAIRFLEEQGALKTLPEALQQAAARRLEYPDLSLAALCGCFDPPMSKSGLSHRMKKLEALADALRQRLEEHTETEEEGA